MTKAPLHVPIAEFIERFVEGYLLSDLKTMAVSGPQDPAAPGHLGYTIVSTFCAGVELLGSLISDKPFSEEVGRAYFERYWSRFLYLDKPKIAGPFYELVRHGLAHAFLVKTPINVTKHQRAAHFTFAGDVLRVDSTSLAEDLERSYRETYRPALDLQQAQARLDERFAKWADDGKYLEEIRRELLKLSGTSIILPGIEIFDWQNASTRSPAPSGYATAWTERIGVNSPSPQALVVQPDIDDPSEQ